MGMDKTLYTEKLITEVENFGYPWLKVAAIVVKEGKFLMVHEAKVKERGPQGETIWVPGDGGWNIPAGRINPGETMIQAAVREVEEETGYTVRLEGICQIGQRTAPENSYTIITFVGSLASENTKFEPNEEISGYAWLTQRDVRKLDEQKKLRSPYLIFGAIDGYINHVAGHAAPMKIISFFN